MKSFGRKQKIGIAILAFGFAGSLVLCVAGVLSGDQWALFNGGLATAIFGTLCGGDAASKWASGRNGGDDVGQM